MLDIVNEIDKIGGVDVERTFDFSSHCSIGVGGVAPLACYPRTIAACCRLLDFFHRERIPFLVAGNMTNVLPKDGFIDKIVLSTKKLVRTEIGTHTFAEAGVTSGRLLRAFRYAEKSGVEFLVGIPCTLGGALYMNAGVGGAYIADIVKNVTVWQDGSIATLSVAECAYSYKHSLFMEKDWVILGAELTGQDSTASVIATRENAYKKKRLHLPNGKSMGCVFKNPNGESAGKWIDRAGLKGAREGGAYVAQAHANFILNDGTATTQDVCRLIERIRRVVEEKFGVKLEEEIRYWT